MRKPKTKKIKELSADEIAEAMVENMDKNMEDPDFLAKKEARNAECAKEALEELGIPPMEDDSE